MMTKVFEIGNKEIREVNEVPSSITGDKVRNVNSSGGSGTISDRICERNPHDDFARRSEDAHGQHPA